MLHGLIQDIEGGYVRRLAFIGPGRIGWPLPIYELALMAAARAKDMNIELSITIATPEDAPLAIFGQVASEAVRQLLEDNGISTITSAYCEVHEPGCVAISPGARHLHADRIVAMPELHGPSVPGVPGGSVGGFIPIDVHCKVPGMSASGPRATRPISRSSTVASRRSRLTSLRRRSPRSRVLLRNLDR